MLWVVNKHHSHWTIPEKNGNNSWGGGGRDGGGYGVSRVARVVLEEHVEIPGVNFRKTEFPGMIKKKVMSNFCRSCFLALEF